jgi:lipoprotein-anchoring transpeptidase ErfK/SrfK
MSTPAVPAIRSLGLAAAALSMLLAGCDTAGIEAGASGFRPVADAEAPAAADAARADAAPPKPKRQIVQGVEVVVNIPSGRLELVDGDSVVKSYPVSVGSARYATPVGDYLLATVIFNPWWNPPPGSAWARNRKRTPPGPGNPMGRVKLHMDELIYIHGTTSVGRLGAPASHGCIRMSNSDVVDLARRLHRYANPAIGDAELDWMSKAGTRERHTVMARSIRMRVTYQVARLKDDRLHVYPDVYGRSGGLAAAVKAELARGGVDTLDLPAPSMARLRQGAARGGASFALAEIPTLRPLPPEPPRETGPALLGSPTVASAVAQADTAAVDDVPLEPAPPTETVVQDTTTDTEP